MQIRTGYIHRKELPFSLSQRGLGRVSRKAREHFGPKETLIKTSSTHSPKLLF